jgi:hypothetical protein
MQDSDSVFLRALIKILTEIFDGPPGNEAFLLNPGDPGLLGTLDSIDAKTASVHAIPGRSTIAAHTDHLLYGISLLNRWSAGEANPWASADWEASWRRTEVNEEQWRALRDTLRREAELWRKHAAGRTEWIDITAAGAISSAAHTAYHFGAIRQMIAAQQ